MKNTGMDINTFATKVRDLEERKRDIVVPMNSVVMYEPDTVTIAGEAHNLTETSNRQIATHASIPKDYYDLTKRENPGLHIENVNARLQHVNKPRLFRTLTMPQDTTPDHAPLVRGFVSDSYRILDSGFIMDSTFRSLDKKNLLSKAKLMSSHIDHERSFLKFAMEERTDAVRPGDWVTWGFMFRTGEVGNGSIQLAPYIDRLKCSNGMVVMEIVDGKIKMRWIHSGTKHDVGPVFVSQKTEDIKHELILSEIEDAIEYALSEDLFKQTIAQLQDSAADRVPNDRRLEKVIEVTSKKFALPDYDREAILEKFVRNNDFTRWGLANAVTERAGELDNYDRSHDLEDVGGRIITMKRSDWSYIMDRAAA